MSDNRDIPKPLELPCVGQGICFVRFQQGIWIVFDDGEFVYDAKCFARIHEFDSLVISVVGDDGKVITTVTREGDPEEFPKILFQLWTTSVFSPHIGTDSAPRIETLSGVRREVALHERIEAYEFKCSAFSMSCHPGSFRGDVQGLMFSRDHDFEHRIMRTMTSLMRRSRWTRSQQARS